MSACCTLLLALFLQFLPTSIAGEWHGDLRIKSEIQDTRTPHRFTFKVDGSKLDGTIRLGKYLEFPIGDGEIAGNKVRFWQRQMDISGAWTRSFLFEGEIRGDELILVRTNPASTNGPQPATFTVYRSK